MQGFFLQHHKEDRPISEIPSAQLNNLMCSFIMNVRKDVPTGVDPSTLPDNKVYHEPDTLTSYYTGIARWMKWWIDAMHPFVPPHFFPNKNIKPKYPKIEISEMVANAVKMVPADR